MNFSKNPEAFKWPCLSVIFEVSVSFNVENRREKFIILISILYPIYRILIRSRNLLYFPRELLMSSLSIFISLFPSIHLFV